MLILIFIMEMVGTFAHVLSRIIERNCKSIMHEYNNNNNNCIDVLTGG